MAKQTQTNTFHSARLDELWQVVRNLPSDQILRVFNRYFELLVEPVVLYTNVYYETIAEALVLLNDARRKITVQDRETVKASLFAAMHCPREEVTRILMDASIERTLLMLMIYRVLEDDTVFCEGVDPQPLRRHLALLLTDLRQFRDLVLNRYVRKVSTQAGSFAWGRRQNGLQVETDDAFQNHLAASMRALDKVDIEEGTITTYIARWLQSAEHSPFQIYLGEAYSITRTVRTKIWRKEINLNNHSVLLDEAIASSKAAMEEIDEEAVAHNLLLRCAVELLRQRGTLKHYRYALLGVKAPFSLTPAEIAAQIAVTEENQ